VDSHGQSLAYVYGHADKRDAETAKGLTLDMARHQNPEATLAQVTASIREGYPLSHVNSIRMFRVEFAVIDSVVLTGGKDADTRSMPTHPRRN
jgi:hypothetical protein